MHQRRSGAFRQVAQWLVCALVFVALQSPARAQSREYQLKAAFLFQFTKFVEWPEGSFASTNSPLVIGILGENPFEGALERLVEGERVNGRPLILRQLEPDAAVDSVHVLFVARSEAGRAASLMRPLAGKPVLTVSDIEGFASRGGCAELFVDQNRIRFRVNPRTAGDARLSISSKLLRLADIVESPR